MINETRIELERASPIAPPAPSRWRRIVGDLRIRKVALQTISELAASLAIGAACAPFFPDSNALILTGICLIGQTALNLGFRTFREYISSDEENEEDALPGKVASYIAPLLFTLNTSFNGLVLWHEFGHWCTAKLLFENPHPTIHITPYRGGLTSYSNEQPSDLGKKIGEQHLLALLASAGPGFTILAAPLYYMGSRRLKDTYPEISRTLLCTTAACYFMESSYAVWTVFGEGGDFHILWRGYDVHPLLATLAINAGPLLLLGTKAIARLRA